MAGWDKLSNLLKMELVQRREEGCDVTGFDLKAQTAIDANDEKLMNQVYDDLMALPVHSDFAYTEPSDLESIRHERPAGPRHLADSLSGREWSDKFLGAWLGRCAGCALGKPVERWEFMHGGTTGNPGWKNIQLWFEGADAWPINFYTPGTSRTGKAMGIERLRCENSQRENIRFMESDDDIRYTVLGLAMLESQGNNFDSWEIGKHWFRLLTYNQVCTAESQAYFNFAHVSSHMEGWSAPSPVEKQKRLEYVRTYRNPYREWIGAQIRADGFAYGAAGNPEFAAEFAWRDASFSHVKNGIYGEMFVDAMIAAAFVENDNEKIVQIGLSEIPRHCRLAEAIDQAIKIARQATDQVSLVDRVWETFKHYDPVHTINNAALVAAALIFAGDDFTKAISTTVLGGWDTDCNGATVGSIMGAKLGATLLPASWIKPLNDTLYAEVIGFHPIPISECAKRSEATFWKLRK